MPDPIEGSSSLSRTRVHNFTISLDGFGTGKGQSRQAPFGDADLSMLRWLLTPVS